MNLSTLQNCTPPGTKVELLLVGGAKLRGRVQRLEKDLVVLDVGGAQQNVFVSGISSFTVFNQPSSSEERPVKAIEEPNIGEDTHPLGKALECRDEIRIAIESPSGASVEKAAGLIKQFTEDIITSGRSSDIQVRKVLVEMFKLIEHHRDRAAANKNETDAVLLSRSLVAVNRALRAVPRGRMIDEFVELYHLFVAVRFHAKVFEQDIDFWAECREKLRAAVHLGRQLLNDPATLAWWERNPHLRTGHYRRLASLCHALVSFGFAQADEFEHLEKDTERFGRLAEPSALATPTVPALGHIVSFGPALHGLIQTRDRQKLVVLLREILTPELRQAAQAAQAVQGGIPVDFDVEVRTNSAMPYDRAVRVRLPGSFCGEVSHVDPVRNFGYIKLSDNRSVHFWLNNWPEPTEPPHQGAAVLCWPETSIHGTKWTSKHIHLVELFESPTSLNSEAHQLVTEALDARDRGDIPRARGLFERGLRECPVLEVVLNYAAMMKVENPGEVGRIYERGLSIEEVAKSYKAWEDAGVFASQRGNFDEAVRYLNQSLVLTRAHPEQRGLKGVLLALGHVHYRHGTEESIRLADQYYQEAIELYGGWESFSARVPIHQVNYVNAVRSALSNPGLHERAASPNLEAHRLVEEAADAREDGDISRASVLYERGMEECPTPQIVCSYAAMMKAVDADEASRIYERGLQIDDIARSSKVWEDAGVYASQRGKFDQAVQYLERALTLAREHPEHRGLKGVLMALGNAHYRRGAEDAIRRADACYQEAIALHGGWEAFRAKMPVHQISNVDAAQAALAQLRSHTPSGNTAWEFLESCGLRVKDAQPTEDFADLVCEVADASLRTDYGLGERIFVRCYLQEQDSSPDPKAVEQGALQAAAQWQCDETVALLILPELSHDLQESLRRRLDDTTDVRPLVIIPLAQRDLEKAAIPLETLRDALAAWLYRRDLFPRVGIVTGAEFFGRQRVLAEINSLLMRGEPIGLFGLRRTGKTSVLQAVKDRQREQGNIVLHADLLGSGKKMLSWLLHALAEDLRNSSQELLPSNFHWDLAGRFPSSVSADEGDFDISQGFFSDLARVLQALELNPADKRPKIILVIDELEALQEESSARMLDLLRTARSLQNRYQARFDYIVTAANPSVCEKGQIDGRDNPVFNCIRPLYLEFLSPTECSEMITELGRGMGVFFQPEALRRVYTATAGHPFFTRWLCSIAVKLRRGRPLTLTAKDILNAEGIYNRDRSGDDIWEIEQRLKRDYPAELEMLNKLARSFTAIPLHALLASPAEDGHRAIRHLLGYQLAADTEGGIALRMELMRRWLTGTVTPERAPELRKPSAPPRQPPRSHSRPAPRPKKWPRRPYDQP